MSLKATRIGYLAGREVSAHEIARQMGCHVDHVIGVLRAARIIPPQDRCPCLVVCVPVSGHIEAIDSVGRQFKMSREDIAAKVLLAKFSEGAEAIADIIERSGHA